MYVIKCLNNKTNYFNYVDCYGDGVKTKEEAEKFEDEYEAKERIEQLEWQDKEIAYDDLIYEIVEV